MLRSSPLFQLYLVRLRDFYRQPARVFWVYGFPTMLAIVLGFAFQNRDPAPIPVDLVQGPGAAQIKAQLDAHNAPSIAESKRANRDRTFPPVDIHEAPEDEALRRLKTGKTPLVIEPLGSESWTYRYDPTRPEASAARQTIDDILQEAAGRTNPRQTNDVFVSEPGSRYIDFLIPGLIGLNAMGGGLWGIGFLLVNFRIAKLLKRFVATPMPRRDFLLALLGARLTFVIPDLSVLLLLGTLMFHMPVRGSLALVVGIDMLGALAFAGIGLLVACRATNHRDRQRADEPGHAADVALLGRLLLLRAVSGRRPAVHPGPAPHATGRAPAPGRCSKGPVSSMSARPSRSSLPGRSSPSRWPCVSSAGPERSHELRVLENSVLHPLNQPPDRTWPRSGGTATSSMRWPRNVALARISVSRNDEADWRGMAASFSSRWSRHGEWTSRTGTAKIRRWPRAQAIRSSFRGPNPAGNQSHGRTG